MPYGSTQPENLEFLMHPMDIGFDGQPRGPLFLFYDQEPILGEFNFQLFDYVCNNFYNGHKFILVTTEKNSIAVDLIKQKYNCPIVYYFHHAFAAHDWFRGSRYDPLLTLPTKRHLTKKYITFNRLTSGIRAYRSLLVSELIKHNILDQGYVSYNDSCPLGGTYEENIQNLVTEKLITQDIANDTIVNIKSAKLPLRVDYQDSEYIPNHSFVLSATKQTQESFCYLVTETCYWHQRDHLTEKIFKPIVSRMPFILVGPPNNLKYLQSYGFKTFSPWINEEYDSIEDPVLRMQAIGVELKRICNYDLTELKKILIDMQDVLEHNYNLFHSNEFLDSCWHELKINLKNSFNPNDNTIFCPYPNVDYPPTPAGDLEYEKQYFKVLNEIQEDLDKINSDVPN
jgi:hypothetical protein